jgi:hypothetical protein
MDVIMIRLAHDFNYLLVCAFKRKEGGSKSCHIFKSLNSVFFVLREVNASLHNAIEEFDKVSFCERTACFIRNVRTLFSANWSTLIRLDQERNCVAVFLLEKKREGCVCVLMTFQRSENLENVNQTKNSFISIF